jgi:signal transduction histidine kinase
MRLPVFMKTIRFRLTLWYVSFLILLVIAPIIGVNVAMWRYLSVLPTSGLQSAADLQSWSQVFFQDLRNYSAIGVGIVIVAGAIGGYFLSGIMLKPVNKVSQVAGRISYTNLKERLNYSGPSDEIKRLADTFDNMLARLDSAVDSQKQFIQDASHELRTPIATALTNIEVLEMNSEATMVDYQNLARVLKLSLERMSNISNSLLLLSEDVDSRLKWLKVNIAAVITEVVNEFTMDARREGISLIWHPPVSEVAILGDTFRIKQVIFNLLDNAIKYNRAGGSVSLTTHVEDRSVAADDLPRIFDRFFRVDKSRSRLRGGSGLGLAIVKKIAEDHRGTVSLTSSPGRGSTFRLVLPAYLPG